MDIIITIMCTVFLAVLIAKVGSDINKPKQS